MLLSHQYERKYETLIKEVRRLEGQLADYNLAMDKSRTSTDPREIHHYFNSLRARNQHEAKEIDGVFLRRQERDQQTQGVEQQLAQVRRAAWAAAGSLACEVPSVLACRACCSPDTCAPHAVRRACDTRSCNTWRHRR